MSDQASPPTVVPTSQSNLTAEVVSTSEMISDTLKFTQPTRISPIDGAMSRRKRTREDLLQE